MSDRAGSVVRRRRATDARRRPAASESGSDVLARRADAVATPEAVDQEPAGLRRPGLHLQPAQPGHARPGHSALRGVLCAFERRVPLERSARCRGRSAAPGQAAPPDRVRAGAARSLAVRGAWCSAWPGWRWRFALGSPFVAGRLTVPAADDELQHLAQASGADRRVWDLGRVRAAGGRGRRGDRGAGLAVAVRLHGAGVAVPGAWEAPQRA